MKVGQPGGVLGQLVEDLVEVSSRAGTLGSLDAAEKAALSTQLLDAFETGQFEAARTTLLARASNPRAERTLSTLMDSALNALGIDPRQAREGWQAMLAKLGTTEPHPVEVSPRMSPARDAFRGLRLPLDKRTAKLMRRISGKRARVAVSLKKAVSSEDPITALRELATKLDPQQTTDQTFMALVTTFAELGAWTDLLAVFDLAPEEFQGYPMARRAQALALLQTGQTGAALESLEQLAVDGGNDATTRGLLGKAYTRRFDEARASGEAGAEAWLDKAIKAYRAGYTADRAEIYPGVCLPTLLEMKGSLIARKEACSFAKNVQTIAKQRIAYGERHYWDFAAMVTSGVVMNDAASTTEYLEKLRAIPAEIWMLDSTRHHLERLKSTRAERGEDTTMIDAALAVLDEKAGAERGVIAPSVEAPPKSQDGYALDWLLEHAYRFGGRSSKRLPGNYHMDGIAHDVRVTPADVVYFLRILYDTGLQKLTDPEQVSGKIDDLVRGHFGTANMESRVSVQHKFFDEVMPQLADYMAATSGDSQTNVSADWINRLADCRQHAPVKLMLYEAWKRDRVRKLIGGMNKATRDGRPDDRAKLDKQLCELNAWEMRILDAELVHANTGEKVEEHTLTLLIHRKPVPLGEEMTELDKIVLADSFYHDVHHLAEGEVFLEHRGDSLWINVPTPSKDGTPIAIVPAPYSRDRASGSVDFGQLMFRGIQVGSPGWQTEVPVDGVDMSYLHDYVAANPRPKRPAAGG